MSIICDYTIYTSFNRFKEYNFFSIFTYTIKKNESFPAGEIFKAILSRELEPFQGIIQISVFDKFYNKTVAQSSNLKKLHRTFEI